MTCLGDNELVALLTGNLAGPAFVAAETHLDVCRRCRLLVSTLATKTGDVRPDGSLSAFGPGDVVAGRYQIVALLGSGGMGEVYEALDTVLGETVALKTLAAGMAIDETGVSRLKGEVQIARRVTHRNVCRVFDVGFHVDDRPAGEETTPSLAIPFFTMELLRGETLRTRLRRSGPLSCGDVLSLLEQMAAGLDAAHAAGIVHRDLKMENVMLVPEPADGAARVVITDFGLAHQLDERALLRMPLWSHAAGTLGYMAPEQLAGEASRPATDIYALGVVLFELLTGELPFSVAEIVATRGQGNRRPPPSLRSLCAAPSIWQVAIDRCLEVAPEARFGSVGELLGALRVRDAAPVRERRVSRQWPMVVLMSVLIGSISVVSAARRGVPTGAKARQREVPSRQAAASAVPVAPPPLVDVRARAPRDDETVASPSSLPPSARPSPSHRPRHAGRPVSPQRGGRAVAAPARLGDDDFVDPFTQID